MSFFDRWRPKWKHPDPATRERGVREVTDPGLLETIAENDVSEKVRLAAVETLTDQAILARIAGGKTTMAVPAMKRVTDSALSLELALTAELAAVRALAVEHIDDGLTLHRIATSDTDASVRSKARFRRMGPDHTRDYIRSELSKLQLARRVATEVAGFCGTLEDICSALIGDTRFRINGGVDDSEARLATIRELGAPVESSASTVPDASRADREGRARFLAFKRRAPDEPESGSTANIFFEIHVWRTDQDTYLCRAEEKQLKIVQDAVEWSRVSNGGDEENRPDGAQPAG